jgi:hypothetical protein
MAKRAKRKKSMSDTPYNPLEKANLARSIQMELLVREPIPLSEIDAVKGAGIYVLYYTGSFAPYASIAKANKGGKCDLPIYIGKAIPKGGRKGGIGADASKGRAMSDRLGQHFRSIDECENLDANAFIVRCLMVDDIWIPLGENMLIEQFKPIWNRAIDGFGNKDPGRRRATQYKSPWDVLHPGRKFAEKLADSELTSDFLTERVADYLAGRPLKSLPKVVARQVEEDADDALNAADEA